MTGHSRGVFGRRLEPWRFTALFVFAFAQAAAETPTLDDFLREPDLRSAALSPDGKHLALVINRDGTRGVVLRNAEAPGLPILGAFSDRIFRPFAVYWGNNERLLVALSVPVDRHRVEKDMANKDDFDINDYAAYTRIVSVDLTLSNGVVLMEDEWRVRNNWSLSRITNFLPNDPAHVLMPAYRDGRRQQYKVNIYTGGSELVTSGSTNTYRFLNDEDGKPLYRFDYLQRSKAIVIYVADEKGGWDRVEKIYLNKDEEDDIDKDGLIGLAGENLVYRKLNEETGYYDLVTINWSTRERKTLVSLPDQDVYGALTDERSGQIVGYMIEKDYLRHVYFDEDVQSIYEKIASEVGDYNFSVSQPGSDNRKGLVRSWGADDPLSYHLWDFEASRLDFLSHAYVGLATTRLAMPAIASYRARDGLPLRAYLLLPENFVEGQGHPTIIMPHGGPHARSRATYDDFAQYLATRGYVVVMPNYRGSVGYGQGFEEAGYKQWGGLMQDDLTDTVTYLVDKGYTDPKRVCIVGGSYGGYAALMGAIKTPDLYRCAVSLNGVTHLVKLIKYDQKNLVDKEDWEEVLFRRIGNPDTDQAMLDQNSPALHADQIRIPVMIIAGTEDTVVPFSQAKMMVKALKKAGADYEFIELDDTGHNPIYYRDDIETVYGAIERFLGKNLR